LATNLAGYCANKGFRVMLGDVDRQQSSLAWLKRRASQPLAQGAEIVGWAVDPRSVMRPPAGVTHAVLDTPGGMRGFDLSRVVNAADVILIPVCDSVFDRDSAVDCHAELKTLPRVSSGRCKVAMVGMRVDARTKGAERLVAWAGEQGLPFLGSIRETQLYVRSAEQGLTLFDLPTAKNEADLAQWQPVLDWVEGGWKESERQHAKARASVPVIHAATMLQSTNRTSAPAARPAIASPVSLSEPAPLRDAPRDLARRGSTERFGWLFNVFRSST
jgi:chromosome partitioning protein